VHLKLAPSIDTAKVYSALVLFRAGWNDGSGKKTVENIL